MIVLKFNGSLNDKAIRLAQLKSAITSTSQNRSKDNDVGPVIASLQNEIDMLSQLIAVDVSSFRAEGNRWP